MKIPQIPFLKNCSSYELIEEGFSNDIKWCVDHTYLLRISPNASHERLEKQARLTNAVHAIDARVPYVYEVGIFEDSIYTILDYLKGENGEVALQSRSHHVQYHIGQQVGRTLKNMHSIPPPDHYPSWDKLWSNRVTRLTPRFEEIANQNVRLLRVLSFVNEHIELLVGRPSSIQHYDFHPGNIIIQGDQFSGLIDMQKITYGDPVNEFYKMEYFNVPVSVHYCRGVLDGYHDNKPIPDSFWALHRLYAAIHIISAEVWANEVALNQQTKFKEYTLFTLDQFDDFKLLIPKWHTALNLV